MGSRKGMSGATWFTENASQNMKKSSPSLMPNEDLTQESGQGAMSQRAGQGGKRAAKQAARLKAAGANNPDGLGNLESIVSGASSSSETKETSPSGINPRSSRMGKARREGERILSDKSLSTEQKQTQALEQRKKYDKASAKNVKKDAKDTERGAIRADKRTKKINSMAKRNNLSVEKATSMYDARKGSFNDFTSKGSGGGTTGGSNAASSELNSEANKLSAYQQAANDVANQGNSGFVGIENSGGKSDSSTNLPTPGAPRSYDLEQDES